MELLVRIEDHFEGQARVGVELLADPCVGGLEDGRDSFADRSLCRPFEEHVEPGAGARLKALMQVGFLLPRRQLLGELPVSRSDGDSFFQAPDGEIEIGGAIRDLRQEDHRLYEPGDRKSTRLNSSHANSSYAVFCLKK